MSQLTPNQRALVRTAKLGFVFQSFNLLPRTTAMQNVIMPLDYSPQRPGGGEARRLAQRPAGPRRTGRPHRPRAVADVRRPAAARGHRPVAGQSPALLLADEPTGNLDSHTSVEILRMFQQLNAEGITVILVTHDPKVAAFAHRTIRIADGLIEGDEPQPAATADGLRPTAPNARVRRRRWLGGIARRSGGVPLDGDRTAVTGGRQRPRGRSGCRGGSPPQ